MKEQQDTRSVEAAVPGRSASTRSSQIIVLGMHRSGTSAATALLARCGAYVGTAEELTRSNRENPRGFFERLDARAICDALLHSAGADWWKVHDFDVGRIPPLTLVEYSKKIQSLVGDLDSQGTWALKEPRLCLLLPAFQRHLKRSAVSVLVIRHPVEVAQSLRRRNGFPSVAGFALWEAYMVAALRHSSDWPRVILPYADLIADPVGTTRKLVSSLALVGVDGLSEGNPVDVIDPSLKHEYGGDAAFASLMSNAQRKLWEYISNGLTPPGVDLVLSQEAHAILAEFEIDRAASAEVEKQRVDFARLNTAGEKLADTMERAKEYAGRLDAWIEERKSERAPTHVSEDKGTEVRARAERAETRLRTVTTDLHAVRSALRAKTGEIGELSARAEAAQGRAERAEARIRALELDLQTALSANMAANEQLRTQIAAAETEFESRIESLVEAQSAFVATVETPQAHLEDVATRLDAVALALLKHSAALERKSWRSIFRRVFPKKPSAIRKTVRAIEKSGLFDRSWYLQTYPDVARTGVDPVEHYVRFGADEGRDPSPNFSSAAYFVHYSDVRASGQNPLFHYLRYGRDEGRSLASVVASKAAPLESFAAMGASDAATEKLVGQALPQVVPAPIDTAVAPHISAENEYRRERQIKRLAGAIPSPYYRQFAQMMGAKGIDNYSAPIDALIEFDLSRRGSMGYVNGPLVSVVMPVFNRATLVGEAIGTVLAQTYRNLELLVCDDGSIDGTSDVVAGIKDARIKLFVHPERRGASAARNTSLNSAAGKYIAYLDSDNLWHPRYLEAAVDALESNEGRIACRAPYYDLALPRSGPDLKRVTPAEFHLERQIDKPMADLNSFVHRADALRPLGGFDERLNRRQDYDLIARYTWLRDPVTLDVAFNIYRRIPGIHQITIEQKKDVQSPALIKEKIEKFYASGLDVAFPDWVRKVTVLSWDMSRNHFAKAYSVAEALSKRVEVELVSFRFFDEEIFRPLAGKKPDFQTKYFSGSDFPGFFGEMSKALNAMTGDVIYAVKPRLPSLGLALMDNYHRGTPIMLEINDLESAAHSPGQNRTHAVRTLDELSSAADARSPYALIWSEVLDSLVAEIPVLFTHNQNLNRHYSGRCLYMRNIKNEEEYSLDGLSRASIRAGLGLAEDDKVILFGGLVRKHKGINELVLLLDRLGDPKFKLLVIGSRESPELQSLKKQKNDGSIIILPPQAPAEMAKINFASDFVVLWLDPSAPVSHFQMPYKLTDAIAMGATVIGSPVSDLPSLENAGALWTVPFGDLNALAKKINDILDAPAERAARRALARRIFEREFTYGAAVANFALGAHRLNGERVTYDVSRRFANAMTSFRASLANPQ